MAQPQPRPRIIRPTLVALLSFPFRLCNPPPAVRKVRSCGVTPLVDVRLQDVLDRRHLPPLGLKDFEEWLLYVERAPENLYFTLWLREYTVKYNQWAASYKAERDQAGENRVNWSVPSSSHLAMFYARAKQTFFMPNSPYELNLPSKLLAPFHASDGSLHPDPLIFTDVAVETQMMLQESLRLFVQAQLNNVGNSRVVCGITAGIFFTLAFCVPPLVVNFVSGHGRWGRLAALPGMLLGLTIIVAALNGICMGVYIFGDLRQLHKFELTRPPISKPRPLSTSRQRSAISCSISSLPTTPVLPLTQPPRLSIIPPPQAHLPDRRRTSSSSSFGSESTSSTSSGYTPDPPGIIDISNVQYDTDAVDGPATSPAAPHSHLMFSKQQDEKDTLFTATATFIHPYDCHDDCDYKPLPEERQPLSSFDFDALPSRYDLPPQYHTVVGSGPEDSTPHPKSSSLRQLLGQLQEKCSLKWRGPSAPDKEKQTSSRTDSFRHHTSRPQNMPPRLVERDEATVRRQWKMVKAVPAFTELTHVLSPVIVRGQWEIVTKSFVIAIFLSWLILGCLMAVPIR